MASNAFYQVYEMLLSNQLASDDVLLDIGAKDGVISSQLKKSFNCNSIAIDIEFQHDNAKCLCSFLRADGRQLPLKKNSIDAVISNMVFEHIPDEGIMIQEISRVLQPEGLFIAIFPNRVWPFDGHGYPPGTIWFPRSIGKILVSLFDIKPEYYRNVMYPCSALGVKRHLQKWFEHVSYESELLLDVQFEDSLKGEVLTSFKRPMTSAFNTSVAQLLVEMSFPVPIYLTRQPLAES